MFCKDLKFELLGSYSDKDPSKLVFRRSSRCLRVSEVKFQ